MRLILGGVLGALVGVVYVFAIGLLEIRRIGQEAGAVYDFNNIVVAVSEPGVPWLPWLAIAALSALIAYTIAFAFQSVQTGTRIVVIVGFGLACVALIAWSLNAMSWGYTDPDMPPGVAEGWRGWAEKGGQNPAVHIVTLFAFAFALLRPMTRPRADHDEAAHRRADVDRPS